MTKQVHRNGDDRSCGATTVVGLQSNVYANNELVAVKGDENSHGGGPLDSEANKVYANNILIVRNTDDGGPDPVPGHVSTPASEGSPNVFAGRPARAELAPGQLGFLFLPTAPLTEAEVVEREPDLGGQGGGGAPGGGAIAPREDGGPVAQAANTGGGGQTFDPSPYVGGEAGRGTCARSNLGAVSERYESNGNPTAVGYDSTGGLSYGSYQIATLTGTFDNWMRFCEVRNPQLYQAMVDAGGIVAYTGTQYVAQGSSAAREWGRSIWGPLANIPEFSETQHDFIQATHFDIQVRKFARETGIDVCDGSHCFGLQDALWSISVQHGPNSSIAVRGYNNYINTYFLRPNDTQLINAIYDERDRVEVYFRSSTPAVQQSVRNRFAQERSDCLSIC